MVYSGPELQHENSAFYSPEGMDLSLATLLSLLWTLMYWFQIFIYI